MSTKTMKSDPIAELLFEIGLALKLNKISIKETAEYLPLEKIKTLADKIDADSKENWDDSHITQGGLLRAALETHEISQSELAKLLDVSPQKISDLISGRVTFTVNWAKRIGKALNVSYKVFI